MLRQQLEQFLYVAKFKNISKAAKALYISQQALSQSIHNLEKDIGAPLFIRTRRGVALTELGKKILPKSEMLLNAIDEYYTFIDEQIMATDEQSSIFVEERCLIAAIPPSILVSSSAKINFDVGSGFDSSLTAIMDGSYNIAFCFRPTLLHGLTYIPLVKETPFVLLGKDHPLVAKDEITLSDIKNEGLVLPRFTYSTFISSLVKAYSKENAYPVCAYEAPDIEPLLQFVRANMGIKLTPSYVLKSHSMEGIEVRHLKTDDFFVEYGFLIKSRDHLKNNELNFIRSMQEYYDTEWIDITE